MTEFSQVQQAESNAVNPVVVIPIYRTTLNSYERISLKRTFSILAAHAISLVVPRSSQESIRLILDALLAPGSSYQWHAVDDSWLVSHFSYNQLMLAEHFYRHYEEHSHLLICQLDAYVFEDRLVEWCRKPFDYIGAPLYPANAPHGPEGLFCVGVGGFSLRRIQPILELFKKNPIVFRSSDFLESLKPFNTKARLLFFTRYLRCRLGNGCHLAGANNQLSRWMGVNEDVVFSKFLPRYASEFRLPDASEAVRFCIDKFVELELAALNGALPFASHAWWTSPDNLTAWTPFIRELDSAHAHDGVNVA